MATNHDPLVHWRYFLALDEDLERTSRYVEFCDDNLECYSLELSRILMMASAEAEVVAKQLARTVDPASDPKNMGVCREILAEHFRSLPTATVHAVNDRITFHPWAGWRDGSRPEWWQAYTDVKHERHIHFRQGNLRNALEAVGGLMVLAVYLYEQAAYDGYLNPSPRLFSFGPPVKTDRAFYNQTQLIYKIEHAV